LPGFETKKPEPGEVEQSFARQMDTLTKSKVMTDAHQGLRALVLRAARAVDQIKPTDAASGQANIIRALNEVAAALPEPKTEEVSALDRLEALFCLDSDEPGPYDNPPEAEQ
jgi:hypothetical protein